MSTKEIGEYIKRRLGAPGTDAHDSPTSKSRFSDGSHYRIELLPTIVAEYEKLFSLCEKYDLVCNRITDSRGSMFDTDEEIVKKCQMCREKGAELVMSPGAGSNASDISQQMAIREMITGKSRGMDMLVRNISDALRDIELGCRGFLVYDEGMIWAILQMRRDGLIPPETNLKISAGVSVGNALALKFWIEKAELGPDDSINPVRDLTFPMLAAIRQVTTQPLDVHVYFGTSVARTLEVPEIVRVMAPVYLKVARFGPGVTTEEKVLQGRRVVETMQRYYSEVKQSPTKAAGSGVPARPGDWKPKFGGR